MTTLKKPWRDVLTLLVFSNTKNSTMKSYTKNTFEILKKLPYKSNIKNPDPQHMSKLNK